MRVVVLPRTLESERRREVRDVETLTEVEVKRTPDLAPLAEPKRVRSAPGGRATLESLAERVDALEDVVRELTAAVKDLSRRPQSRGL
jgi:hypothetical protein